MLYEVITGDTTECITGQAAGIYSVTVANGSGCSAYENAFVFTLSCSEKQQLVVIRITSYNVCYTKLLRIRC